VTEIRYPGSNGQASSSAADKVVFTYFDDGTIETRTDQNQTVITYVYNTLRNLRQQRVTTVGSGVDGTVRRIRTEYTDLAQVEKISSVDNVTVGSGNTLNEVKFTYNGYGQLTKDEQDHDSAVDGSTPSVQYAYTESTANNHSRLASITYPNGRLLYMRYTHSATSTWQDETNDAFSRIGQLAASSSTDPYIEYTFAGSGRLVKRKAADGSGNKGNDTQLNLDGGTADEYAGLDLFGRVVDQKASAAGQVSFGCR